MTKKLRVIAIMIGLTLAGIIYFQIAWIKTSYRIWDEQFDTNIREALTSAIEQGLQDKLINLSKCYVLEGSPGTISINVLSTDSIKDLSKVFFNIEESELIYTESYNELEHELSMSDSLNFVIKTQMDSITDSFTNRINDEFKDDVNIKIDVEKIINVKERDFITIDTDTLISQAHKIVVEQEMWLDTLINQVVKTKINFDGSTNYENFNNILKDELTKLEINLPYNLGIIDINNRQYNYLYPANCDTSVLQKGYKVPLLGNSQSSNYASLFFPDQNTYVIKKLLPLLLGSIFLFLITAASFVFMFQTLFKQKQLSEVKSDFVNNMTHELKTPISTVSLALEALQDFDGLKDKHRTERYLNIARNENNRLALLVNKILKMSTYEQNDLQLRRENCNISACLENVCKNFEVQLRQEKGKLNTEFEEEQLFYKVDKVHFNNVIYNLLDNAMKYSSDKPEIKVRSNSVDGGLQITVSDNGIGISKEHQQKIFDKFYRIPSGDLHHVKGHGLGLSYVKKIVEAHNGTISIESKLGKGSKFKLFFPTKHKTRIEN